MNKHLRIGWKVSTLDVKIASLRYRAILPMFALESYGVVNRIFKSVEQGCLTDLDVLVIVKSFTVEDVMLAQEAVALEIPVIFDLCDNIFIDEYSKWGDQTPAAVFLHIANIASAIVVTTEPLAEIVSKRIGDVTPVYIVPDGIESDVLLAQAKRRLLFVRFQGYIVGGLAQGAVAKVMQRSKQQLGMQLLVSLFHRLTKKIKSETRQYRQKRFWLKKAYRHYDSLRSVIFGVPSRLSQQESIKNTGQHNNLSLPVVQQLAKPNAQKILWFGNHGANHASFGMLDLLSIREPLETLAKEMALELVVVSNNRGKFDQHIKPFNIPTRYIEWKPDSVATHIRNADVVVIPNSLDDFSICKSSNRSVMALSYGVPVVATATPALEPLRGCITLDDFEGGLRRYLTDKTYAELHVQEGKKQINVLYGQPMIGQLWHQLLCLLIDKRAVNQQYQGVEVILVIHLPQDVDLARPLLAELHRRGVVCAVWLSLKSMKRWHQIIDAVMSFGVAWRVIPDDIDEIDAKIFPSSTNVLLSVTETNLGPHQFAHQLTKLANEAGIFTATMQHGYENVGLSYNDKIHPIQHVSFASSKVYIWGNLETLHPDVPAETRAKCVPVGCPKPAFVAQANVSEMIADDKLVVGIFENLHWHRYSDSYRDFFLAGVRHLAQMFPNIIFLIKPHNAGMWLTGHYKGEQPEASNLMVADPKQPFWASVSAPQLLGRLSAVITTPSTVAFDAARIDLPVAVVAHGLALENYAPLQLIEKLDDWCAFVKQVLDDSQKEKLKNTDREFVGSVSLAGDAAARIADDVMAHKSKMNLKNV